LYRDRSIRLLGGSRYEQALARRHDPSGDGRDLIGRLSRPKNDFREALTYPPVVVHPGETEVLERRLAYKLKEAFLRGLRRKRADLDSFQERAKLVTVHRPNWLAFVDFPFSRAIESAIVPRDGFISL
jgi:hypothetical protein